MAELLTTFIASSVVTQLMRSKWVLSALYDSTFCILTGWNFITSSQNFAKNLSSHIHLKYGSCWCEQNAIQFKIQRVQSELQDFMNYCSHKDMHFSHSVVVNLDHLMHIFEQIKTQIKIVEGRFKVVEQARIYQLSYWTKPDISDCLKKFDRLFPQLDLHIDLFLQAWRDEKLLKHGLSSGLSSPDNNYEGLVHPSDTMMDRSTVIDIRDLEKALSDNKTGIEGNIYII